MQLRVGCELIYRCTRPTPMILALSVHYTRATEGESAPTKYWLSTLPADADLETLVATAKMRWRIERDYQELKQELGLGHYEGRGWRGFHHHMALCVAAYGFLVSERSLIPPSGDKILLIPAPPLSPGYRPRGSANPSRTPHQSVNRNDPN